MSYVESVLARVKEQNPNEPEFHQAVTEVLHSLEAAIKPTRSMKRRDFWSGWSSRKE